MASQLAKRLQWPFEQWTNLIWCACVCTRYAAALGRQSEVLIRSSTSSVRRHCKLPRCHLYWFWDRWGECCEESAYIYIFWITNTKLARLNILNDVSTCRNMRWWSRWPTRPSSCSSSWIWLRHWRSTQGAVSDSSSQRSGSVVKCVLLYVCVLSIGDVFFFIVCLWRLDIWAFFVFMSDCRQTIPRCIWPWVGIAEGADPQRCADSSGECYEGAREAGETEETGPRWFGPCRGLWIATKGNHTYTLSFQGIVCYRALAVLLTWSKWCQLLF